MQRASFLLASSLLLACGEPSDGRLFAAASSAGASGHTGTSEQRGGAGERGATGGADGTGSAGKSGSVSKGGSTGKGGSAGKGAAGGKSGAADAGHGGSEASEGGASGDAGQAGAGGSTSAAGSSASGAGGGSSSGASGAGGAGAAGGAAGTGANGGGVGGAAGAHAGAAGKGGSVVPPPQEATIAQCTDGKDNDGDGSIDCRDADCKGVPSCVENTNDACSDGLDNDGDGHLDCDDYDCSKNTAVTVCGKGDGACSDGWEPNNSPGQLGAIEISDESAEFCFEQTICQKDTDWLDFAFVGADYGGKISLTITLLSPPNGSSVVVRATDLDNEQAPIDVSLTTQNVTKSLAVPVPLDCGSGFCLDQKRRVKISTAASTPLTYRLCAEVK